MPTLWYLWLSKTPNPDAFEPLELWFPGRRVAEIQGGILVRALQTLWFAKIPETETSRSHGLQSQMALIALRIKK
jgi:hypothetical protein